MFKLTPCYKPIVIIDNRFKNKYYIEADGIFPQEVLYNMIKLAEKIKLMTMIMIK